LPIAYCLLPIALGILYIAFAFCLVSFLPKKERKKKGKNQ
jgi:hypothetical protein